MDLLKKLFYFFCSILLAYLTAYSFGKFYVYILNLSIRDTLFGISPHAAVYILGAVLSYIFFITFLFTALTTKHKYWWIGILLIPAFIFECFFDLSHIYFPIILALIGWGLGSLIYKFRMRRVNNKK